VTAQTQVYLYNQRQHVVLLESAGQIATRRYDIVYAKELSIQRGVSNLLEFAFINQEQKPVNLLGKTILFRAINYNGTEILIQKPLTLVLPLTGITSLQLTAQETEYLPAEYCYYTLQVLENQQQAVFTDAQGASRGILRVVNSIFPNPVAAYNLTIPTHVPPSINKVSTYTSSTYNADNAATHTFQVEYDKFIGNIQFQGSNLADFTWNYTIENVQSGGQTANTFTFGNQGMDDSYTGIQGYTVIGYHPFIRIQINNQGSGNGSNSGVLHGDLTQVWAR